MFVWLLNNHSGEYRVIKPAIQGACSASPLPYRSRNLTPHGAAPAAKVMPVIAAPVTPLPPTLLQLFRWAVLLSFYARVNCLLIWLEFIANLYCHVNWFLDERSL